MSSPIISVTNLSKSYMISHEGQENYTALRDVISNKAKKIFSFGKPNERINHFASREEFFALNDVSFNINPGDRVGIIGRNGAGKSTLLKLISRITEPTAGSITIKGRVASLLEVGTGFHPELTGRENIFLNGAILGMSRSEIKNKFDEIVDFSEVAQFLDTPVKRYSSGMYVRLAFAVAAHLEPEVLVVDEVLAVGDAQFQKKCLGKMEDVSRNAGRTILFVSHNLGVVKTLCNTGLLLTKGKLMHYGDVDSVIKKYTETVEISDGRPYIELFKSNDIAVNDITINKSKKGDITLGSDKKIHIVVSGVANKKLEGAFEVGFFNIYDQRILFYSPGHIRNQLKIIDGQFSIEETIELPEKLIGDQYKISIIFAKPNIESYFYLNEKITMTLEPFISITGREFTYDNSGYFFWG